MTPTPEQRRLAAILAADVAGYTRLVEQDTEGTVSAWRAARSEVIDPTVSEWAGRVVKLTGDGFLAEFSTVQDAVQCAMAMQSLLAESRLDFRMGISMGDVIDDGEDVHGEGVNIAARIEALADPGSICVTGSVYEQIRNRIGGGFEDLGEHHVKHVSNAIHVYRIGAVSSDERFDAEDRSSLSSSGKPALAILPFDNLSDDSEQQFFADGIAEDVIAALSRFHSLFVIARSTSFAYRARGLGVTEIARELGVRYVVEGSVRKASNRVRITAQLIDAHTSNSLWADRFDGALGDLFDLQDQIAEQIVVAIEPRILSLEQERVKRRAPNSLDAWETMQRGLSHFYTYEKAEAETAIDLFREAISMDPGFAEAHARLAFALYIAILFGFVEDQADALSSARTAAERAVSLDANEPMARVALSRVRSLEGNPESAIREARAAVALNPNFAWGHYALAHALHYGAGQSEEALAHFDSALRLSPQDPWRSSMLAMKGASLRNLGRFDEAVDSCMDASHLRPNVLLIQLNLAGALADAGRARDAQAAVQRALEIEPAASIGFLRKRFVGMDPTLRESVIDSLRRAGLPE